MIYSKKTLLAAIAGLAAAASALAIPTIRISDGVTTTDIADGSAGDAASGIAGLVSVNQAVGSFAVNSVNSNTLLGSSGSPVLNTTSLNIAANGSAGDFVEIWFSETGFGPTSPSAAVHTLINATSLSNVSVEHKTFVDTVGNALFGGALMNAIGPFTSLANYSDSDGPIGGNSPYSVTQYFKVTLLSNGQGGASFDATTSVPDGGATAGLLGLGLVALGAISRRKRN